jgi:hypothetical protein
MASTTGRTSSPTRLRFYLGFYDQPIQKWTPMTHPDSDCGELDMVGKIKRLSNQPNWFHLTIHPESTGIVETIMFWCCDTVCWAVGPCIASETIRDETRGHTCPNTLFIQQLPSH